MTATQICEKQLCSACGVCKNICPVNAIEMSEDEYGFLYPSINPDICISCGLCEKNCPNNLKAEKYAPKETLALQSKNFKLSSKSASGGFFAQLAEYVLSVNGVIFGCTIKNKNTTFIIKHICIDNVKELYKLQGSKYVQSDIGSIYQQVKKILDNGTLVLFSGTPCQNAGLKNFLQKDYQNLICVDLSCTGVPSSKMFNDYIEFLNKKFNITISNFEFRNKEKLGWNCGSILIKDSKNKEKIILNNLSSYTSLFINKHIVRESCIKCQYNGLLRVSDFTLGDCWGIETEYPQLLHQHGGNLETGKGISLVLINTEKGIFYFQKIKSNLIYYKININKILKYNGPLNEPPQIEKRNMQYLEEYKNHGYKALAKLFKKKSGYKYYYHRFCPRVIKKIFTTIKNHKKNTSSKVAIMCCYYWPNYGSILTAYALRKTILDLGYSAEYINLQKAEKYGKPFNKKYGKLTKRCVNFKDLKKLNKHYNTFILGSDYQLYYERGRYTIYRNLFNFADKTKKKIIISGSFGNKNFNAPEKDIENIKQHFQSLDYVSVRENSGKNICENLFNTYADWITDPIFFLNKENYYELFKNVKENYSNKILEYVLYNNNETRNLIDFISRKYNKEITKFYGNQNTQKNKITKDMSVENWLKSIAESDIIITDSFHCLCFAIMFDKPFILLYNENGKTRFDSLNKLFKINIPSYKNLSEFLESGSDFYKLDSVKVNKIISEKRQEIIQRLQNLLSTPKVISKEQLKAEQYVEEFSEKIYKKKEFWYIKNHFLYVTIIEPIFVPIVRYFKKLNS